MKKVWNIKSVGTVAAVFLLVVATVLGTVGLLGSFKIPPTERINVIFYPPQEIESDFDEKTYVVAEYVTGDGKYVCPVRYESLEEAENELAELTGTVFLTESGSYAAFPAEPTEEELRSSLRDLQADENAGILNLSLAVALAGIAVGVMRIFGRFFSTYEKIWFLSVLILAAVFAILFPEEECNGVSGILIMALYLADTLFNILCELLISKQSKWNFLVSVLVELTEIAICVVLSYRFATMATTLFFWLPIDIVSFINWNCHPDEEQEELTCVRRLRGWQEVLILAGIAVWTLAVGWLFSGLNFSTDLFGGNEAMETAVCYLDACASAVGVANGLFIFFRIREQWIAWYVCAVLETVINVLSGQYVLLILKAGYLTNTTYGYLRWTSYIRTHKTEKDKTLL